MTFFIKVFYSTEGNIRFGNEWYTDGNSFVEVGFIHN